MKNKKVYIASIAGAVAFLCFIFIGYHFLFSGQDKDVPVNSIINDRKITFRDSKAYFRNNQFISGKEDPNKYFANTIINTDTVKFFKILQMNINEETLEEHLKAVKNHLHSIMDSEKADQMFALYNKFCTYEIDLAKKVQSWPQPRNADELLRYLAAVQDYRREVFGAETADAMWGVEVKGQEYNIRKGTIINDPELYGAEKERLISALKAKMWGTGPDSIEEPPREDAEMYAKYQEKEAIFKRDLESMSEDQRREKIAEFRNAIFTTEQVNRLMKVDEEIEQEKRNENEYYAQENRIKSNQSLNRDEQERAIRELQDHIFGDEAEAFRRRQNIDKDLKTNQQVK